MFINQLTATNLRSLEFITLTPEKNVNIIIGKNNDGKTTLLEGIYYCSTLKSFKQVSTSMLIKNHSKSLKVLLKFTKSGENTTISIEKNLSGGSINKINDKKASAKQLFINLPVLALNFGSTNIVTTNSDERRSFLDWGVFHVEHNYIDIFKDYQKAVKQRNSLLKKKDKTNLDYWTGIVVERGNLLHSYRESYFNEFNKHFILLERDAEELKDRVARRAKCMIDSGLIEEVKGLLRKGIEKNPNAANAIGYRESIAFLKGEIAEDELLPLVVKNTNGLVKKQKTWFRSQLPEPNERIYLTS